MFRKEKQLKHNHFGAGQMTRVALVACLVFGCVGLAAADGGESVRLAPIRFKVNSGGNLSYIFRRDSNYGRTDSNQTESLIFYSNIRAYSFIWQPWLARITGGLGFNANLSNSNAGGANSGKSTGVGISGDTVLNLLPQSRFPFAASISKSNTKQKSGLTANDTNSQSTVINLTQNYHSRNFETTGLMIFTHGLFTGNRTDLSKDDNFVFELEHIPFVNHSVKISGGSERIIRPQSNFRSLVNSLRSSYNYRFNNVFSTGNSINLSRTQISQLANENYASTKQFSSQNFWRPKDSLLAVTGSARLFDLKSISSNGRVVDSGSNAYLAANYRLSKNINGIGSINVEDRLGVQRVTTNLLVSSSKALTDVELSKKGSFVYKRYISGTLANRSNSSFGGAGQAASNSLTLGLAAGHSLTNNTMLYGGGLVSNVYQTIQASLNTGQSVVEVPLLTGGSIGWGRSEKKRWVSTSTVRLTASDSRKLNGGSQSTPIQLVNLQVQRKEGMAKSQSLLGHLTLQMIHQGATPISVSSRSQSINGAVEYGNTRVFGIRNLLFNSTIQDSYTSSTDNTRIEQVLSWENSLQYAIGRLSLSFTGRLSRINKVNSTSLLFNANRSF